MTANQIAYWGLVENQRANRVREATNWFSAYETQRHDVVGEQLGYGNLTETTRHNKAGEDLTNRSILATIRGQDVSAETARRGQDLTYEATTRGQDLNYNATTRGQSLTYNAAIRGQDLNREISYDKMLSDYKLGSYTAQVRANTEELGQLRAQQTAQARMSTDLVIAGTNNAMSVAKSIFGGIF